jgi:hypothetical protein
MCKKIHRRNLLAAIGAVFVSVGIATCMVYSGRRNSMNHVVLVGDSSLDNGTYVARGEAVIDHLQRLVPHGWKATLLAVDGGTTGSIPNQLARLPDDTTHIVVSVGGNDALRHQGILSARASSVAQVLGELATIADDFETRYEQMLAEVLRLGFPTVVCTIYYPQFPDLVVQKLSVTASTIFNDVILRQAFVAGLPLMDLRLICNEETDYANPIEPSSAGAHKIALAIRSVITQHDFARHRTEVFV